MTKVPKSKNESLFPLWLTRSKVHPTNQRVHILERPLLVKKLDSCLDATLSFIHAPAGYGKSTLYADWRSQLLDNQVKVCWLSLDTEDNELFQLLTYIAFSLFEGGVNFNEAGIRDSSHFVDLSNRKFLSLISHIIELQKEKVVLILDDFENLNKETVDEVIQPLLTYAPNNLHIAIASRDHSKLKIAHLESQGLAIRILAESMRFNLTELADFFDGNLSETTIHHIYQCTEGWPVTIQMLRNSMGDQQDIDYLLSRFNNSSGPITTYLSEQILDNLDQTLQSFLMDISLLDRVSCEFANYLRDKDDSFMQFKASNSLNTLVLPVERVKNTYRLHPLFRDFLYQRLTATQAERAITLHLRTADWFAMKGNVVMAVRHAVQANQVSKVVEIIVREGGGIVIWLREGLTRLRAVIKLLDQQMVLSSTHLMIIRCLIDLKDGKVYQARINYDKMIKHTSHVEAAAKQIEQGDVHHELMLLKSLLACYEGKMLSEQFCLQLNQNISNIAPHEHATLGHHYNVLCFANVQRGMFKLARTYAEKATEEFKLMGSVYGELYINFHLGDISFAEGKSETAKNYYQAGLRLARQHFNDDQGIKLVANVLMAELKYELNQMQGLANITANIPKQLETREAWFDIYAAGYVTASNVEFYKHGIDAALSVLDQALAYAKAQKQMHLTSLLIFQRIDLLLRAGMEQEAQNILSQSGLQLESYKNPGSSDIAWRECHAAVYAITLLQIKQQQFSEALSVLAHFSKHAKSYGHIKSCIRYDILKCLAYQGKNNQTQAFHHLDQAVLLSFGSGFTRSFIDGGNSLKTELENYIQSDKTTSVKGNKEHAARILQSFVRTDHQEVAEPLLSKREFEVLEHLICGESNKVIARNIDVSENTVRFHLKNIFVKLNVSSRLQAVTVVKRKKII